MMFIDYFISPECVYFTYNMRLYRRENSIRTKRKGQCNDVAVTTLIVGQNVRRRSEDASGRDASIFGIIEHKFR